MKDDAAPDEAQGHGHGDEAEAHKRGQVVHPVEHREGRQAPEDDAEVLEPHFLIQQQIDEAVDRSERKGRIAQDRGRDVEAEQRVV